jgi:hypothetical protein
MKYGVMGLKVNRKYQVVPHRKEYEGIAEIRLYEPCKRTIFVESRSYYVQFPHVMFMRFGSDLCCVFLDGPLNKNSMIYMPPLANIYGLDNNYYENS